MIARKTSGLIHIISLFIAHGFFVRGKRPAQQRCRGTKMTKRGMIKKETLDSFRCMIRANCYGWDMHAFHCDQEVCRCWPRWGGTFSVQLNGRPRESSDNVGPSGLISYSLSEASGQEAPDGLMD